MKKPIPTNFGFLIVGTLWGYVIAFLMLDSLSRKIKLSSDPVRCLVIYPIAGVMSGLVLDLLFSNRWVGRGVLVFLLVSLLIAVVYLILIFPGIQRVRE